MEKNSITPRQIVQAWVDAFNRGDIDALGTLYAHDAINHQVITEPLHGRAAIMDMFKTEFSRATMVCQIENIFEDGAWCILEWSDPSGLRGCGFFQTENGHIIFQRGYFDQLTFLRSQGLEIPD